MGRRQVLRWVVAYEPADDSEEEGSELDWCHAASRGYPWVSLGIPKLDARACLKTAKGGHLNVLQFMHVNGRKTS